MKRKNKRREDRAVRRRNETAVMALVIGVALLAAPWFVDQPALAGALAVARPFGYVMLLVGGVLLVLGRVLSRPAAAKPVATTPVPPAAAKMPVASTDDPQAASVAPASKPQAWSAAVFEVIEWRRFEAVVEALFRQAGFETRSQSHGADGGVDIWLHSSSVPDRPVSVVQCKHWQGKRVGVDKVRELRGVMAAHGVRRGQFATTSTFTPDAVAFGQENSIHLLDVQALLALIATRTPEQQQALLAVALEGDYWRPTCVNCGTKLVERVAKGGESRFWGCAGFPKCRTTMAMRLG
ncbi:restriction endonuclease [Roseateles sp. BYS96W]|uniref:Restriction endonuclease n=1 Tax=Pelomonas nitida TaxID=3299027 RepID=A0ABW7G022_9BURK